MPQQNPLVVTLTTVAVSEIEVTENYAYVAYEVATADEDGERVSDGELSMN